MTDDHTSVNRAAYRIELPYAVFSIDAKDNIVAEAAPIARWMIGKPVPVVLGWANRKGGTWTEMDIGQ